MPNWKKVIVSGSDASLKSINVSSGSTVTGSFLVSGSTTQIGSNNLLGNTSLSGSLTISGSQGSATPTINIFGDVNQTGYTRYLPVTTNIDTSISASYIYVSGSTNDLYFSQNGNGFNNVTRLRWIEGNLYTGLLNGGVITSQSSTVYQISSGSGIIVNLNPSLNDNPYPVIQYLNWSNLSASIAPLTASYQQAFVGIDSTNNIYQQGDPFSNGQFDTLINIGTVLFQNQSTINGVKTQPSVAYGFQQSQNTFNRAFGPLKLSGFTLAPSGSSTGSLIVGSGTAYAPGANYIVDPSEPYYVTDSGTNISKIFRYHQSGSTWVYDTNAGAGYGTINPGLYSNNGVLTTVQPNDWSIQRVFWFPNSVAKAIVVYYGNASYSTEANAIANINIEPFVEAPNTAANAIYLGAIIIRGGGSFTAPADFTIVPGGLFRQVGGSGGGGSLITQTLSGLSDVAISGPTNLQPFVYSTTAGKWINSSSISGSLIGNASTATTASYALSATSASYALTASNVEGGTQYYVPLWNTGTSLTNSYLNQSGSVLKTIFSGQDKGLTLDYNTNSFILGNAGTGNNTYFQVYDGGSTINVYSPNYTYFNDKVGVRIIPTNPGLAVSGALEVTGPDTSKFMNSNVQITGSLQVTAGITGSLFGTSSWSQNSITASYVTLAQTASYVLNAVSSSFATNAQTASYITSLNQNVTITGSLTATGDIITQGNIVAQQYIVSSSVAYFTESFSSGSTKFGNSLDDTHQFTGSVSVTGSVTITGNQLITGSLTVGASSLGASENTITLGARDTGNEGGQIGFNAPGGTYTSASFIDNWSNFHRILVGTNANSIGLVAQWNLHSKQMELPAYTSATSFVGTATANLAVDSSGKVITVATAASPFPYTGNAVITGSLTVTQPIYALPNGGMYFQGGDDAALYDVNIVNTLGVYGVQDSAVGSIRLGSGGGTISGKSGFIGINNINPSYALDINANTLTGARVYSGSLAVGNITPSATVGRIDASNDVVAFSTSDIRFKENIQPIDNALNKIDLIGGYTFDWKTDEELVSLHGHSGHDVGVIAHEIESILPEIVTTRDNGYKAVKYEKIVPLLIQAIKELKAEVDSLKAGNYNKWD